MIGQIISHYRIIEKLGEGGMGIVYKAMDTKLKRHVALKFLPTNLTADAEAKERFIQEAQAASALDHPNICTIYEINQTEDGQMFIAMAHYGGETLKQKIAAGPLPIDMVIDLASQIAKGLAKAHQHGIIHRDIKPANIIVTDDGLVKILDFGLAKLAGQSRLTRTGTTLGTVAYMSPEQVLGEKVDNRTDIWSLGVVLYEMITGQLPFKGEYDQAVLYSISNEEPKPISELVKDIPSGIEQILDKCLNKELNQRYETSTALSNDLQLMQRKSLILIPSDKGNLIKNIKNRPLGFAAVLTAIILAAAIIILIMLQFFKSKPESTEASLQNMPSIAIMYFEDATGDKETQWLSRGLPHMLITNLEQIPALRVIGYQRLYDILKELGNENIERIDKTIATQIAKKAKVKTMLLGNILKWKDRIRIDFQLQDVDNGDLIYADNVTGEDPFTLADNITDLVKKNFRIESSKSVKESIQNVTTNSLEAYRYYLQGQDFENKGLWEQAWQSYAQAIRLDTTFAIVYLDMWWLTGNAVERTQAESDSMLNMALRYAEGTSERERLRIYAQAADNYGRIQDFRRISMELLQKYPSYTEFYEPVGDFHYFRRELDKSLLYYKKWLILSNNNKRALENVMSIFDELGEVDSAQFYLKKFQLLYPNDPYLRVVEIQYKFRNGDFDGALREARFVVEINPDVPWSHRFLGLAYFFADKFDSAEAEFKQVGIRGWTSEEMRFMVMLQLWQGKYRSAIQILEDKKRANSQEMRTLAHREELNLYSYSSQTRKEQLRELWLSWKPELYSTWRSPKKPRGDTFFADSLLTLAVPDAFYTDKASEALRLCDLLQDEIKEKDLGGGYAFRHSINRANILYSESLFLKAAEEYENLVKQYKSMLYRYRLADCYYHLGEYGKAKNVLVQIKKTDEPDLLSAAVAYAFAYPHTFYLLGLVHEALNEPTEAIGAYQKLLDIWKNADRDLPELIDAKSRLEKLKHGK